MGLFGIKISLKHPFGKHSLLGGAARTAGKLAPLAALIPGLGPVAAGGLAGLGRLAGGGNIGQALMSGAMGAGGASLLGGQGFKGLGGLGQKLAAPNLLGNAAGKFDLGKLASLGAAGSQILGANSQRRSAERYNNAQIDQRNQLMSKILAAPQYNFQPTP